MTRKGLCGVMLLILLSSALTLMSVIQRAHGQGPVPAISGPALGNQATIDVTIDFGDSGRAILDSEIGNPAKVEIVGGTAGGKVSQNSPADTVWLVTINRWGGNSDVNVTVHSGWYQDEAGNWNLDASKVFIYDGSGPDIGITNLDISKTVVGQGYALSINVTLFNYGGTTEQCNVTLYANTTVIHTFENVPLTSGNFTTITFTWNTTGFAKGNYTLWVYATPIPGETHTVDNTFTGGNVVVAMIGDISGPTVGHPDGKVDIRDLAYIAKLYGAVYPDPRYNANCDLTGLTLGVADGKIDIRDLAAAAKNYGKVDP